MKIIERTITKNILTDLKQKMVFISGPRQVGKTTLVKNILSGQNGVYLNWDNRKDRRKITEGLWPEEGIVVLDEFHKYRKWKQFIKGEYDQKREGLSFLITGSARLNIYKRGGDSLQGRYHHYRLHPFSVAELNGDINVPEPFTNLKMDDTIKETFHVKNLLEYGGFPEPFINADALFSRRWHKERFDKVIHEDIRDISNIKDISSIELLVEMLPERVGSPLSLNSIREDLEVSHRAVTHWMNLLQQLYVCFRIHPFKGTLVSSLKKEAKAYMWDWAEVEDPGARFENMIACHLLKLCHGMQDIEGYDTDLWYLRNRYKNEVDFLVTVKRKPWFGVEVKLSENRKNHLQYFKERLNIPYVYFVSMDNQETYKKGDVVYTSAGTFLRAIGI